MSENENLSNAKLNDIDKKEIKEFIEKTKTESILKEEIQEMCTRVEKKLDGIKSRLEKLENAERMWKEMDDSMDSKKASELEKKYGTEEYINVQYTVSGKEYDLLREYFAQLCELIENHKNFNKSLCFANIRELLRQKTDVKIGQIEKEAGVRLGYMSRLEKEGNTSEPSMEFIVTAAKLLKVSVDTLISANFNGMTPTEQYIANFFDKLKAYTLEDRLEWKRELHTDLNKMECDMNEFVPHPLFSQENIYQDNEDGNLVQVPRIIFNSNTYGPHTYITGDCFNLRLKNGAILYLMDIEKNPHIAGETTPFAKEAWMYIPNLGKEFIVGTQDSTPIAPMLDSLFETVKEQMEHPQLNSNMTYIIDSFMRDDFKDDVEDIPF